MKGFAKTTVLILFLVIIHITISCCARIKLKSRMDEIMQLQIDLPEQLLEVDNGVLSVHQPEPRKSATMVIYYGKEACSECKINHLYELIPIYEASEKYGNFEVLTIFSPNQEDIELISRLILSCGFQYPLYLDTNDDFLYLNPEFPKEEIFDSILIDCEGQPIFIGNPVRSIELWNTFKSALSTIGSDGNK